MILFNKLILTDLIFALAIIEFIFYNRRCLARWHTWICNGVIYYFHRESYQTLQNL